MGGGGAMHNKKACDSNTDVNPLKWKVPVCTSVSSFHFEALSQKNRNRTAVQTLRAPSSPPRVFLYLPGDAGSFLLSLSRGLKGHRCPEDWPQSLKDGDKIKEDGNR